MKSSEEEKDFTPSSKLVEMENGKVEEKVEKFVEPDTSVTIVQKRKFSFNAKIFVYYSFEILAVIFIIVMNVNGSLNNFQSLVELLPFLVASLALLIFTTYMFIFTLKPRQRFPAFVLRFIIIVSFIAVFVTTFLDNYPYYYNQFWNFLMTNLVLLYPLLSHSILQTYLVFSDKTTKELLFKKAVEGSPSELEWRRYDTLSGLISIVSGIFLLQMFWLIYHFIIRSIVILNTKRRLIIEHLDFNEETNLSTISLELGIPLEEVIFTLKQLQMRRKIKIDFTRYGAILKEIRTARLFTPAIDEKFEEFLKKQKMTEIERRASGFIEFTEREKVLDKDMRKLLGIKDKLSTSDFILMLPPKVATVRSPVFRKGIWIIFNREEILKKREKIIQVLVDNNDKIFN